MNSLQAKNIDHDSGDVGLNTNIISLKPNKAALDINDVLSTSGSEEDILIKIIEKRFRVKVEKCSNVISSENRTTCHAKIKGGGWVYFDGYELVS